MQSLPVLIRRLHPHLLVLRPIRIRRGRAEKEGEIERAVALAAMKLAGRGGILMLLDADEDCPAQLAPRLRRRARQARSDVPIHVVLAQTEFEAWFLAGLESLRGQRGIPSDAQFVGDPEAVRGAKERLSSFMGRSYREMRDQPAFTSSLDLHVARASSPSLDKLMRELDQLAK